MITYAENIQALVEKIEHVTNSLVKDETAIEIAKLIIKEKSSVIIDYVRSDLLLKYGMAVGVDLIVNSYLAEHGLIEN